MSEHKEIVVNSQIVSISDKPSDKEMERIRDLVEEDKRAQTHGEYDRPGIEINVALKDSQGCVLGGVMAITVFRVMHLEVLWVAEDHRRQGYGGRLVLGAEQIGLGSGCITSQTWTFSFQGPEFYPSIGYEHIGSYDGYPNRIMEHAFMKRLRGGQYPRVEFDTPDSRDLCLTTNVTEEDKKILHEGLHRHVVLHVGDGYKGIKIRLVARDQEGGLIGGLSAWTTLQNLVFDHIWIDERFRGNGLGRSLMEEMERIAGEKGCIASQAYCFSFQAPGFFEKMGYKILGISDGYPPPVKELYLIKKYQQKPGTGL